MATRRQFKKQAFRILASDEIDIVVVAPHFLPELKKLPDDVLNVTRALNKIFEARHSGQILSSPTVVKSVSADLTPALGRMNDHISEEIYLAMDHCFPPSKDSFRITAYKAITEIIAQTSGRIFIGPEHCRNPEYIDHAINFTKEMTASGEAIKKLKPWVRPFLSSRLPEVQKVQQRREAVSKFFAPIIKERLESQEKHDDMMQWMMARDPSADLATRVVQQLGLTFAAIHTTSIMATNVLYSLAATPEYQAPLREEIRSVLADNGGRVTPLALQKMFKLDSYMKEVNRWYPTTMTTFRRYVQKPFVLSNGQVIPAGVLIEAPSDALNFDADIHKDPYTFDGFRFYKARENADAVKIARSQFVATNEDDIRWGLGKHACPGRFFAANEIKIILARLLLEYDIAMPDGLTERYKQIEFEKNIVPDPTKELLFKKI
ncbi:hypothetical protein E8E13_002676 [Curvularia kusanoi]|uniref:Uncharacterized protein n=1 Tax=Curvularia kusanoi TaxID=90978 RepID=A0A9P4W2D4_CURKU|nr:hypothetical protein E8E13_002676 [Curvularia kusanoi]